MKNNISPFNNSIETGLRILCILNEVFPKSYDMQSLIYLDYMIVHSGDIDEKEKSLHPDLPYRKGEIYVRRSMILNGIKLFKSKNLIEQIYSENGIEYKATEESTPFIENLEEDYFTELCEKARWLANKDFLDNEVDLKKTFIDKLQNIDIL